MIVNRRSGPTPRRIAFPLLVCLILASTTATAEDRALIASMDELRFQPPPKGTARLVAGKVGQAVEFHFDRDAQGNFAVSNIHGTPEWDRAAGFSFWIKGDGSEQFAGLQFIFDEDYAVRYDLVVPLKGAEWRKVTVGWDDLVPVLPGPRAKPLGGTDGNPPSRLSGLWFGRWWYWADYPALTFAIDEIRLEPAIERDRVDDRPSGEPLAGLRSKLRRGQAVTIVTMGDSLTDKRHWANREVAWVDLVRDRIKGRYGVDVNLVNPAIGGTQLRQNVILIPRWLARAPEPDLVAIFFGGNDWDAGMRGEEFTRACEDAVDRVRKATGGKADVLLITTNPTATRWTETAELAEACRRAARSRNCGLADTERAFHGAGREDRNRLYVEDRVHLSRAGHDVVADTVLKAIADGG
jgi:lysophospholipase L1-like esterase